ncbi:hypothetical protein [Streptomyces kanamyceticus]|uniref:WXG100 family type VII secretion target n=1 Tax=Streptomyces kanamyceticus TaxID=1967 RepID=A0A5J6GDN4_STRKN|nr:hypothetical protein [Streptomyces kanamyceticus]QEU92582.1 hypothetical protein CP970_18215 [Streptomyces kanamyceticus]
MAGARTKDWQPLADHDPVPGDPDRLEQLGRKLRKTADELERQVRHLKAASEVESWDSDAGKEFREKAKKCRGRLEAAHKRYKTVADEVGDRIVDHGPDYESNAAARPGNYATELHRAQRIAEIARQDAQDAEADKGAAQKGLDGLSGDSGKGGEGKEGGKGRKEKLEDRAEAAGKALEEAREKLRKAQDIRDAAAKKAREAIDDVISGDALKDGFWDGFADFVEWAAGWTELISKWAGIAALAVGWIPIIGQGLAGLLGAISMVATLVNIACTAIQVAMGDESWTALATAAVGLLMMGAGKAMSKVSGRYAKGLLGRMRLAKGGKATPRQLKRNRHKLNHDAGVVKGIERGDISKSITEPVTEIFKSSTWKDGFKGGYREAAQALRDRGNGSVIKGGLKSMSLSDASVASDLKELKHLGKGLGDGYAVNQVSSRVTALNVAGSGITAGGLLIDEVS